MMIFVALILAAASSANAVPQARQAYSSCLSSYTSDAVARQTPRDSFVAGLKSKCAAQESAFRSALIAADKQSGMSDGEAAEDANTQISGYITKMTATFDRAR